jgi:hypothetical protein
MKTSENPIASGARLEDLPLYLMTYDHAVGCPRIQGEARKTIELMEQNPELKTGAQIEGWTLDWMAKNDPAFLQEMREWMARFKGRWLPAGGSYGQPHFTFVSEESTIRQMFYGTRALKEHLGFDNDLYLYSEHETMPQMPQVLTGMGYRGAYFRTHMQYGGDGPARDADWVLWTGPDGSSIPAIPAYSGKEQCDANMWLMTGYGERVHWPDMEAFYTEMRSRGVQHPLISRCDDWGTRPKPELLRDMKAHAKTARWVTAPEYFDMIERSGIKPVLLPVGPNDFFPDRPWGLNANRVWNNTRSAASRALAAEALAVTAIQRGLPWTPDHQTRLDDAWKNLLMGEHHDADLFNEARDFTDPSHKLSLELSTEAAEFLALRARVEGDAVFVFNPTGHPRTEAVFLRTPGPVRAVAPDGSATEAQQGPDGACFIARDIPALGYRVYRIEPGKAAAAAPEPTDARTLETDRYQVAFAPEGGIVRLWDKLQERHIVKEGARTGYLEGMIGSRMETSSGSVRQTYAGPGLWRVVETGSVGPIAYEMTYTFVGDSARIDLDIHMDIPAETYIGNADPNVPGAPCPGGEADNGAKLRYVFQAELERTTVQAGSPPTRFAGPRGVRHQPMIIQTAPAGDETLEVVLWAAVETDRTGLAITNCGTMGYRAVGSSLEPVLAYSGKYSWGCLRFIQKDCYTNRLSIVPYGGHSLWSYGMYHKYGGIAERGKVHRHAVERDRPLYVLEFRGQGGDLPLQGSAVGLPATEDAVTVLALFPQDGKLFLRLCDMSEKPVTVSMDRALAAVNLALTERKPVASPVLLHPWKAQTYEILPSQSRNPGVESPSLHQA